MSYVCNYACSRLLFTDSDVDAKIDVLFEAGCWGELFINHVGAVRSYFALASLIA